MKNAKSKTTTVLAKTLCYSDQTVGRLICPTAARHDGLEAKLPGVTDVHLFAHMYPHGVWAECCK